MTPYDPHIHHRRSIRLKGYNYTKAGMYFITICTQHHRSLFGIISDGVMQVNAAGAMVQSAWDKIPLFYPSFQLDAFVLMPNHIHGIIDVHKMENSDSNMSVPDLVHRFKTLTTKKYADGVRQEGWLPFPGKLWQRNYWDRIIRNEKELNGIREYIQYNVKTWQSDELYLPPSTVSP